MTKHQLSKIMFSAIVAGCMLLDSTSLFAQVKIGTNPTVINAANNLEVEASTTGNKVSVDKTTGKVTIADGSQGAGKVLTSDASGVATWQLSGTQTSPVQVKLNASVQNLTIGNVNNAISFGSTVYDVGVNKVGNTIVVSSSGLYDISSYALFASNAGDGGGWGLRVFLNGVLLEQLAGSLNTNGTADSGYGRTVARLNAGDVLSLAMATSQSTGTFTVYAPTNFMVVKISN